MPCLQTKVVMMIATGVLFLAMITMTAGEALAGHFYRTAWQKYDPMVRNIATRHQIDPRLIHAVIWQESNYNRYAVSSKGARGLMQLMPATARDLGVRHSFSAHRNIDGGTRYLLKQIHRFSSVRKALQAYHCGPSRVASGRVPSISKRYANQVIARFIHIKQLYPAKFSGRGSFLVSRK